MSRMVRCPKCRAILQEPPPGHPYYKCGSCFTVLQAKHAAGGSGPQQPIGEDIPDYKQPRGFPNLDPAIKVGAARRQQVHDDAEDDPSSQFRRQKTLPSRLIVNVDGGDSDSNSSEGKPLAEPDAGDPDTSAFRRPGTLPSRLPHAIQRDKPGASRAGSLSKARPKPVSQQNSVEPAPAAVTGRHPSASLKGGRPSSQSEAVVNTPVLGRQITMPIMRSAGAEVGGNGEMSRGVGLISVSEKQAPREFQRQKSLPNKYAQKATTSSGVLKTPFSSRPVIGGGLSPERDAGQPMFRRQQTLPSRSNRGYNQEGEDEVEQAVMRPSSVATKQDVSLPTKLQVALDKKLGNARRGAELKSDIVIPVGIQQMLRKKVLEGVEDLNPRLLEKKAAGSKGDKLRAGGEGAAMRRPNSRSQSRDFTNERESRQPAGRAALREALLSGARQEGGQQLKGSSTSFGEGGGLEAEEVAAIVEWAQANGVDPREALVETGFRGEEVQHRRHVSASGDLRGSSEGLVDGMEHVERGGHSQNVSWDTTVNHSDAEESVEWGQNGRFRGMPSSQSGKLGVASPRQQQQGEVDTSLPPLLPPPDAPQVVQCQLCTQMLAVPAKLPSTKKMIQKLRCGKCLQVSSFRVAVVHEVPFHTRGSVNGDREYHTTPSQGPNSISFEGGGPRAGAGNQGSIKIRNSAKQSSSAVRANQGEEYRRRVIVNGVLVPDWVVEIAEERAGPIHPGDFWYDSKAGFWGVMGGPCLGMIPAGIRELSSPMPRECAGGTTGVVVNGRELHRKDLELLRRRGLSESPRKAYLVDITGRVVEAATGLELRGLGKLAPS